MDHEDAGPGNPRMFPVEDLERLYRLGGLNPDVRISGRELNRVLGVTTYKVNAWYVVTSDGVKKL